MIFAFTSSSSDVKDFLFLLYLSVVSFSSSSISAFCCKASSLTAKIFRDPTFQNAIPYSKIVIYQKILHSRVSNKRTCTYVYFFQVKIPACAYLFGPVRLFILKHFLPVRLFIILTRFIALVFLKRPCKKKYKAT